MIKTVRSQKEKGSAIKKKVKVDSILITQPRPETDKSPYFDLAKKYKIKLEFHAFIRVEGLTGKEFRKQRVDISEYTGVIFTSRNAVDHFFRICEENKVKVSPDIEYFCITEAVALYLQKFIFYRKRKVFYSSDGSIENLLDLLGKHKNEKYILSASDAARHDISLHLTKFNIKYIEATLYRTVSNDITTAMKGAHDMIVFFSPYSVQTLFEHNPKFKQTECLSALLVPLLQKP